MTSLNDIKKVLNGDFPETFPRILGKVRENKQMKDEMTTDEIFQESMKLSEEAWKEKGEKLKEYQEWLNKKWRIVE